MGTSENKISQAPEALSRPSLLSTGAPSADHNILDAMPGRSSERAEAANRPRRQWWWLLPLLAATAWGVSTQLAQPPAVRPAPIAAVPPASPAAPSAMPVQAASVAMAPAAPSTPQAAPSVAASVPSASPDPFQSLATAPGASPETPVRSPQANPVTGLQASMNGPAALPTQPERRAEQASKPSVAEKKPATAPTKGVMAAATPSPSKPTTPAARKTPAPKPKADAQASATAPQQAKASATATPKASSRDPDVELLNAIMKHLGDGKAATTAAAPTRSPQTIAELVKSCRTKDAIEELMCQRRICEGSWGKAQACPKEQAPKAAKTASPA
jgi:hypothetical protein